MIWKIIFLKANALKVILTAQEVELKAKNEIADKILSEVQHENAKAEKEKEIGINLTADDKFAFFKLEIL